MPENKDIDLHLKMAINRRAAHLIPIARAATKVGMPAPSQESITQYQAACERMRARNLLPEQIGIRSRRSFNLYRAALVYKALTFLGAASENWANHGHRVSAKRAHEFLNRIERYLAILRRYPPAARDGKCLWVRPPVGPVRKSKRLGLSKLLANWRLIMLTHCARANLNRNAMLVLALTGLRPAELSKGVVVEKDGGRICVSIKGAKVTGYSGQPLRQLWFDTDTAITKALDILVKKAGGRLVVDIQKPKAFSDFVRGLSHRLFPEAGYVVSPYSFRHAFAADRKAAGVGKEALAKMLGHVSGRSQQAYGVARQGRSSIAAVQSVVATRAIRTARCGAPDSSDFSPSMG